MDYNIILFDADGTLLDFKKAEQVSFERTMRAFNLPYSHSLYCDYHTINDGLWKDFESGLITKPELFIERFRRYTEKYNLVADAAGLNRFYFGQLGLCGYLLENAAEVCRKLSRDRRLYLVTNGETNVQQSRFARSGLSPYFKDIFVSETAGYPKPHIGYFEYVFGNIENFDRSRTVIIGDSLSGDITGGNRAGIDTCWYNADNLVNESGAVCTYVIRSLDELFDIL
ncbi:MAG: YjjG family noncanonical pyrimidine nucleotidase [Eubacteriales bacterium]|jgi:2-haloacid dehalogenase|nr:YjjG family noncanonical pyrimidine nucleotidase [Eubacteriales bacterium]